MKKYDRHEVAKSAGVTPNNITVLDNMGLGKHGFKRLPKKKTDSKLSTRYYRKLTKKEKEIFDFENFPEYKKIKEKTPKELEQKEKLLKVRIKKIEQDLVENKIKIRAEYKQEMLNEIIMGFNIIKQFLKTCNLEPQKIKEFQKIIDKYFRGVNY